jgi:hypothetical protein
VSGGGIAAAVVSLALLSGCASGWERSQRRWAGLSALDSPYARWTGCISDRSYRYLEDDAETGVTPPPASEPQLFTRVLADCRELMTGQAWAHLRDRETRRLIADAYHGFGLARAEIFDRRNQSTIETRTDAQD